MENHNGGSHSALVLGVLLLALAGGVLFGLTRLASLSERVVWNVAGNGSKLASPAGAPEGRKAYAGTLQEFAAAGDQAAARRNGAHGARGKELAEYVPVAH